VHEQVLDHKNYQQETSVLGMNDYGSVDRMIIAGRTQATAMTIWNSFRSCGGEISMKVMFVEKGYGF